MIRQEFEHGIISLSDMSNLLRSRNKIGTVFVIGDNIYGSLLQLLGANMNLLGGSSTSAIELSGFIGKKIVGYVWGVPLIIDEDEQNKNKVSVCKIGFIDYDYAEQIRNGIISESI